MLNFQSEREPRCLDEYRSSEIPHVGCYAGTSAKLKLYLMSVPSTAETWSCSKIYTTSILQTRQAEVTNDLSTLIMVGAKIGKKEQPPE